MNVYVGLKIDRYESQNAQGRLRVFVFLTKTEKLDGVSYHLKRVNTECNVYRTVNGAINMWSGKNDDELLLVEKDNDDEFFISKEERVDEIFHVIIPVYSH